MCLFCYYDIMSLLCYYAIILLLCRYYVIMPLLCYYVVIMFSTNVFYKAWSHMNTTCYQ
jgi:hypothetical protein